MAGNPPDYIAYIVDDQEGADKAFWREVGAVWKHRDSEGFDLLIHSQISLAGRVVCRRRTDNAERPENGNRRERGSRPEPSGRR